jgi:hypothetical protein
LPRNVNTSRWFPAEEVGKFPEVVTVVNDEIGEFTLFERANFAASA